MDPNKKINRCIRMDILRSKRMKRLDGSSSSSPQVSSSISGILSQNASTIENYSIFYLYQFLHVIYLYKSQQRQKTITYCFIYSTGAEKRRMKTSENTTTPSSGMNSIMIFVYTYFCIIFICLFVYFLSLYFSY